MLFVLHLLAVQELREEELQLVVAEDPQLAELVDPELVMGQL